MQNQCDGCRRGLPIVRGIHQDTTQKGYGRLYMACTKKEYTNPPPIRGSEKGYICGDYVRDTD